MAERKKRGTAGDKTICLPIAEGIGYERLVRDTEEFRAYLDRQIAEHPELLPAQIGEGDCLHGFVRSEPLCHAMHSRYPCVCQTGITSDDTVMELPSLYP